MGFKTSIKKRLNTLASSLAKNIGRFWSRYPFVDIFSIHLGHTLIESAYMLQHRPILVFWRRPVANRWLVEKLENNLPFPTIQKWINKISPNTKKSSFREKLRTKATNLSDQYYLLNLGFNCLPKRLPELHFNNYEEKDSKNFLTENSLQKEKYVCFCIRDESYYMDFKPDLNFGGTNNFNFRNAKIQNYEKAAKYLNDKGIRPVLMGFSSVPAPKIFFRPSEIRSYRPWIEAFLMRECLFCVGMQTGITLYASYFQRPVLWCDVFWRGSPIGSRKDLILPKKIYKKENPGSFKQETAWNELHMKEWVRLGPPPDNDWAHFLKKGYKTKACSPKEIQSAVSDMLLNLKTKKVFLNTQDRARHREFSKIHLKKTKKMGFPPTRLAPTWAAANQHLFFPALNHTYEKFWLSDKVGPDKDFEDAYIDHKTGQKMRI